MGMVSKNSKYFYFLNNSSEIKCIIKKEQNVISKFFCSSLSYYLNMNFCKTTIIFLNTTELMCCSE